MIYLVGFLFALLWAAVVVFVTDLCMTHLPPEVGCVIVIFVLVFGTGAFLYLFGRGWLWIEHWSIRRRYRRLYKREDR